MSIESFFSTSAYQKEKQADLKIIQMVIDRFSNDRPLEGIRIIVGHLVVMNAITMVEALWKGGADVVFCSAFPTSAMDPLSQVLNEFGLLKPVDKDLFRTGDYFLDTAGFLVRHHIPQAAVEVTRTGELYYENKACPVISIDSARIKLLEDFLGTGESFVRAWHHLRPNDPLDNKHMIQFGYGKVGRGIAHKARSSGMQVTIVDPNEEARKRASLDGFSVVDLKASNHLKDVLSQVDVVLGITGIPGAVGRSVPAEWLRANTPVLVTMGFNEFGDAFKDEELLGGADIPINFHLARPTQNKYIDPTLAAQVFAIEELVKHPERYAPGIHRLPEEIDSWLLRTWRKLWPEEDLSGIEPDLV